MNGECFDISSQKSLNNQIMASSQGHFQLRDEKSDGTPRPWANANSPNRTDFLGETSQPGGPVTKIDLDSRGLSSPGKSPDVEILYEVKKDDRLNNFIATSDVICNEKINSHSASKSGRELNRYGPKRILNPSKYNASPYVNQKSSRYPVTTRMIQLHDAIVTLSLDEDYKYKTCIDYGKVTVTYFSFGTSFATNGLVDTYTINAWCRKLSLDNRPKESKVHHFFTLSLNIYY